MIFNSNISKRESDVNLSDATATSGDIISGKTAYGSTGKIVGTLVPGTDTSDATATSGDILYGKTAYIASGKATGSMINRGAVTTSLSAGSSYTIPAGYHNGSGIITANSLSSQTSGTATASDIVSGKTAWVGGSKLTGTYSLANHTSGTATASDILSGKTAWVNGTKLTGTLVSNDISTLNSTFGTLQTISNKTISFQLNKNVSLEKIKMIILDNNISYSIASSNTTNYNPIINSLIFINFGSSDNSKYCIAETLGPTNIVVSAEEINDIYNYYNWSYTNNIITFTISTSVDYAGFFYQSGSNVHKYSCTVYYT